MKKIVLMSVLSLSLLTGCTHYGGGIIIDDGYSPYMPPAHAPAYGRRHHLYHYYPTAEFYFDVDRNMYFYLDTAGQWSFSVNLPLHLRSHLRSGYVEVEMEQDRPYLRHKYHKNKYNQRSYKNKLKYNYKRQKTRQKYKYKEQRFDDRQRNKYQDNKQGIKQKYRNKEERYEDRQRNQYQGNKQRIKQKYRNKEERYENRQRNKYEKNKKRNDKERYDGKDDDRSMKRKKNDLR